MTETSTNTTMVRLGAIAFINTLPVYFSPDTTATDNISLHYDHPAALNKLMATGALDISPVSSAHYLKHQNNLILLDDLSVSSAGAVESVLFISKKPLHQSNDFQRIAVPDDSATSIQLLKWILENETGKNLSDRFSIYPASEARTVLKDQGCALVIGDNALLLHEQGTPEGYYCYDLSSLWKERTGLPFVFAVWVANRAWGEQHLTELAHINATLIHNRDRFFNTPELMQHGIHHAANRCGIAKETIRRYYTQCLQYTLDPQHREALSLFGEIIANTTSAQDALPRDPQLAH